MTGFSDKNSRVSRLYANEVYLRGKTNNKPLILKSGNITPTNTLTITGLTMDNLTVNTDASISGTTRYTKTQYAITANAITEPTSRYCEITTNGGDLTTITETSATDYAEIVLIPASGVTFTVSDDIAGSGNIQLQNTLSRSISGNRSITLRKSDINSYWVEVCASNPIDYMMYQVGRINVENAANNHILSLGGPSSGNGYPIGPRPPFNCAIDFMEMQTDDESTAGSFTGSIVWKIYVNGTNVATISRTQAQQTTITQPTGTTGGSTTHYYAYDATASPHVVNSGEDIVVTIDISGTDIADGVIETSAQLYVRKI